MKNPGKQLRKFTTRIVIGIIHEGFPVPNELRAVEAYGFGEDCKYAFAKNEDGSWNVFHRWSGRVLVWNLKKRHARKLCLYCERTKPVARMQMEIRKEMKEQLNSMGIDAKGTDASKGYGPDE